ncbi:MAG: carboxypeptidase regulatory-like domain-containing protein [Thermoanaerobaculia bacterium]|nr:carboxypeptidase regulatory-like domain-containing protein [Thermoanaerobaculia bacterium]MBP9823398.1 carboxypeptidase regulatory-like domain-containing protein [Thermoanaerobaculia bacterium]
MHSAKMLRHGAWALGFVLLGLGFPGDAAPASAADAGEEPLRIQILRGDRATLQAVQGFVDVDHRRDPEAIFAYATPEDRERLRALGIPFALAPELCGSAIDMLTAAEVQQNGWKWDQHPTYAAYTDRLQYFADNYPSLVRRVEIGATTNTVRPHKLLALKIGDHPDADEDEPEVFLSSTMHGDETTGYVLLLHLIDELLTHYDPASLDPYAQEITRLVDSVEIWINPLANPDGTYSSSDEVLSNSSRRYYSNPNGSSSFVDPNRNFADPQNGAHPDGNPYWAETQRMMDFGNAHRFALALNFHGGAEVVNYPWDTWSDGLPDNRPHADEPWYQEVAHHYANLVKANAPAAIGGSSYFSDISFDGTTNGWEWYEIDGGRQDWMNWWRRCREVTIEVSSCKTDDSQRMPDYWTANRQALLDYIATALTGIRGLVTDAYGTPLEATVKLTGLAAQESEALTDPAAGDYHRLLGPGTYALHFTAAGFEPGDSTAIPVAAGDATRRDVVLLHNLESPPLFADNFEVGAPARWSATVAF